MFYFKENYQEGSEGCFCVLAREVTDIHRGGD